MAGAGGAGCGDDALPPDHHAPGNSVPGQLASCSCSAKIASRLRERSRRYRLHMTTGSTQFRRHALRYFATVAEEGQFSRAAEKLHIAQPALSQAMARLESDLGFKLLDRHSRGVTLTPAGEMFLEKAREALAAEDDALSTAGSLARNLEGAVAFGYLGLPPALTHPGLIEAFAKTHPEVEIRAHELPFPTVSTASWLREVDAAIATRPTADPEVQMQPLSAEPRVVLAPKDHRFAGRADLSVVEVLDETFIGFDPSVDPAWAGFWSLDDHRGGPAPHIVGHAITAQERFAHLLAGQRHRCRPCLPRCGAHQRAPKHRGNPAH